VAFLPADLDRRYAKDHLPDHASLLASLVRWVARDDIPLSVDGPGLIDCHLYRQADRLLLHLVNLSNPATWRAPIEELLTVGPFKVTVRLQEGVRAGPVELLVSGAKTTPRQDRGWVVFEIPSILDHELAVIA
jgi:hypothetical protein